MNAFSAVKINNLNDEMNDRQKELVVRHHEAFKKVLEGYGFEVFPDDSYAHYSSWNIKARHIGLDVAMNFYAYPLRNCSVHFRYEEGNGNPNGFRSNRYGYFMSDSGLKKTIRHIEKKIANGEKFLNKLTN